MGEHEHKLPVVLVTDCGSTTTKAILFEPDGDRWHFAAQAEAPTTVEAPLENIVLGVREALQTLQRQGSRPLMDHAGALIRPSHDANERAEGCDLYLSTCSAGGGLQLVVAGVTRVFSTHAAQRAALGAGALIMDTLSLDESRSGSAWSARLHALRPDMILLAGGTDEGSCRHVVELAEWIRAAGLRPRMGQGTRLPVIFAGNPQARDVVREILGDTMEVVFAENVLPTVESDEGDDARRKVHQVFMNHVMKQAPGTQDLVSLVDHPVLPTPAAVGNLLHRFANHRNENLLAVDLGGATTDLFTVLDGTLERTVSANLGLSYSVANVMVQAGLDKVLRWLPMNLDDGEARNQIKNKMLRPTTLPMRVEDLFLEQALAREALRLSLLQHQSLATTQNEPEKDFRLNAGLRAATESAGPWLSRLDWVIASGGVLSHAPRPAQAALMMLDAFQPWGLFRLAVDRVFMLPHLGALLGVDEHAALDLIEREALALLGFVLAPSGQGKQGDICLSLRLIPDDGPVQEREVHWGELLRMDLPPGCTARLIAKPRRGVNLGRGSGVPRDQEIVGGSLGLLVDARGRPLSLPDDQTASQALMKRWMSALGALPERTSKQEVSR